MARTAGDDGGGSGGGSDCAFLRTPNRVVDYFYMSEAALQKACRFANPGETRQHDVVRNHHRDASTGLMDE